jgi:hypothetical protein
VISPAVAGAANAAHRYLCVTFSPPPPRVVCVTTSEIMQAQYEYEAPQVQYMSVQQPQVQVCVPNFLAVTGLDGT